MVPSTLAPGLLLAAPRLGDPNFERSVVLLAHHDDGGALGWVLNGKPLVAVGQLLRDADLIPPGVSLPDSEAFATAARVGGPVMPGSAWLLFERKPARDVLPGEHDLGKGFAMTGAREAIEALARGEGPDDFRLFLGYAGWGPGQVEGEIRAGAWLPAIVDVSTLLSRPPESIWDLAYHMTIGTSPMAFGGTTRGMALRVPAPRVGPHGLPPRALC
jgi:putative transcriptional regulator